MSNGADLHWQAMFRDPMLSMDRLRHDGINGKLGQPNAMRSLYWKVKRIQWQLAQSHAKPKQRNTHFNEGSLTNFLPRLF